MAGVRVNGKRPRRSFARSRSSRRTRASRLPPASAGLATDTPAGGSSNRSRTPEGGRSLSTHTLIDDRSLERDACGIGLVADVGGRASRELLDRALAGLAAVAHRGAWAADGVTGDGAGMLLPLSPALTGTRGAGLAMCFLREPWLRNVVEEACRAEGLEPAGWRDVPLEVAALGSTAVASMPRVAQLLLAPCDEPDAELRAYRARRRSETVDGVYVASLSFRTVTYKALCAATQLASFYPDLTRPVARGLLGDLPPTLLDQHRAELGACAAVPPALPQRRDQHDRRQRLLDGGPRAGPRRRHRARHPRSTATARTRRCSTTRSSCSCAPGGTCARRPRCSCRPPGRTTRASTTTSAPCTATTRCSSSPGTVLPGSSSPTASRARRRSTATASVRCGSPWPATSSPWPPRQARSRCPRAPACDGRGSGPGSSCRSTPNAVCSSTAS